MNKEDITNIAKGLKNPDDVIRKQTLKKLFQTNSDKAINFIVEALSDANKAIQDLAMQCLIKLNKPKTVQLLIPLLRSEEPSLRNAAKEVISNIGYVASDLITELLKDEDDDIRIAACDILGALRLDETVESLIRALNDPNSNVRSNAAVALGMIGDAKAVGPLVGLFKDNEWVRFCAIEALGKIGASEVIGAVNETFKKAVKQQDDLIIWASAEALGYLRSKNSVKLLLGSLNKVNVAIREMILAALVEIAGENFITTLTEDEKKMVAGCLINSLSSTDERLRTFAVNTLAKIKLEEAVFPMVYLTKELETDDPVLNLIKEELARMGFVKPLVGFLDYPDERLVNFVVDILGKIKTPEAIGHLIKIFDEKGKTTRRIIARNLIGIKDKKLLPILLEKFKDSDGHVRSYIAQAIGKIGGESCINPLMELLYDDYEDIRESAISSLIEIGGKQVKGRLLEIFTDKSKPNELRVLVAGALGRLSKEIHKDKNLKEALIAVLAEGNKVLKKAVIKSLGSISDEDLVKLFPPLINDPDRDVRQAVIEIWQSTGSVNAGKYLIERLKIESDIWTKYHLIKALGTLKVKEAQTALVEVLNEKSNLLKIAAIETLGQIGAPNILEYLRPYANSNNPDIRQAVENIIKDKME